MGSLTLRRIQQEQAASTGGKAKVMDSSTQEEINPEACWGGWGWTHLQDANGRRTAADPHLEPCAAPGSQNW